LEKNRRRGNFARLSNHRSTGKAGGNWGREAEGWKKEIDLRDEEGEGKEEEMDERHVCTSALTHILTQDEVKLETELFRQRA
jgi:hypothetical protein